MRLDRMEVYYTLSAGVSLDHGLWVRPGRPQHSGEAGLGKPGGLGRVGPPLRPDLFPRIGGGVYHTIREYFAPPIVGREFDTARDLVKQLKHFKGNYFAKGAVEIAWWLLKANLEKKPLHKLLGGTRTEVEGGIAHGIKENLDMLMEAIQKGIDAGYKRTKLKFARGWGLEMLKPVRANFPKHTFHIDCNSSFTLDDLAMFKEVDKLGLAMIEQPLAHDDLLDHATLQAKSATPICLDESIKSVGHMRQAIALKACRYVNIKHGRVGGLQSALDIHNLARDNGIPAWVGGMLESSVAIGVSVELGTLENFVYPNDVGASSLFLKEDLTEPTVEFPGKEKVFKPSSVPGIPYLPTRKKLAQHTREKFILERNKGVTCFDPARGIWKEEVHLRISRREGSTRGGRKDKGGQSFCSMDISKPLTFP